MRRSSRAVIHTVVLLSLCSPILAAEPSEPAAPDATAACRALHTDKERLTCYDKLFGAPEGALVEQTPSPPAQPVAVKEEASLLDQRWELSPEQKQGTFKVSPYKPVYIMVAHASSMNNSPKSPSDGHSVLTPLDITSTETKFQLSLKSKLWEDVLGNSSDLWFGYTQSSRWQLFNASDSRPFRETDYEPELILNFRTPHYSLLGWEGRMASVSFTHQSNGRQIPLSRSWNRVVGQIGLDRPGWSVMLRPWWRVHEDRADDDNPDIEDFMGRGDLLVTRNWRGHELSVMFRHSLRTGDRAHGAVELNWAFPIHGELKGYLQFFNGYGESLIDYNHSASYVGLGVSLIEWYSHTAEVTRY